MKYLTRTDKWTFEIILTSWYQKHKIWLNKKEINNKKKCYTHKKINIVDQ